MLIEKMETKKEIRRSADPSLATNVDKRVTSPENAPTPLLRDPVVEVELRVPRELDMAVELEPRDTEKLENTTLPVNSDTKAKTELMVPAVEDAVTVKEEKAKVLGEVKVVKEKKPLRNLPPLKAKPPLSKAKRPRLRRPLKKLFKKSPRRKKSVSLMMITLRTNRPLPSNSPV